MSFLVAIFGLFLFFAGFVWLGKKLGHPFLGFFTGVILVIIAYIIMRNNENVGTILLFIGPVISIIFIISMIVKAILVTKEKVEEKIAEKEQQQINNDLLEAVKSGDAQAVQELLEYGADANYSNSIKIAVENGNKEIVSLLIESGADINKENPLVIAVRNNNKEIVELLLENGAKVNFILDGKSLLDMASDKEIIRILKKNGAKTKSEIDEEAWKTRQRYELQRKLNEDLITAVQKHEMSVAEKLISEGADVNYTCKGEWGVIEGMDGATPLMFAIAGKDMEMIKLLLKNGADIDKEFDVWTGMGWHPINAISFARYRAGNESIARFLEYS